MRMIKVTEAAKQLGVSRQTLENWGKVGTLRIHKMGRTDNANWVDADTIDAVGDVMIDVERARERLESEREAILEESRKERELLNDIRGEVFIAKKLKSGITDKAFYLAIPPMLHELGVLNSREAAITTMVIEGRSVKAIAEDFGLTRARIGQIFFRACHKAACLKNLKEQMDDYERLKAEIQEMKIAINVMSRELERYKEEEKTDKEDSEEDRRRKNIEDIVENDVLLKLFNTNIVDTRLSVRSLNCLKSAGINTIGELVQWNKTDLLKIRSFGKKSLTEIDDFLEDNGLSFGIDVDAIYRERVEQRIRNEQAQIC